MDIDKFVESGILEEYCIGWLNDKDRALVIQMAKLHPQVKEELTRIEIFMEQFAKMGAVDIITPNLRERVLESIEYITENYLDLDDLPVIDKKSDYQVWLNSVQHLIDVTFVNDIMLKVLRSDAKLTQTLVISKISVPKETHTDLLESLLILKGECECSIGNDIFRAGPGDLIEIPLYVEHDVRVLSPYVVAIVQHQLV